MEKQSSRSCGLFVAVAVYVLGTVFGSPIPVAQAQVALDPNFGTGGVATFDFGGAYDDVEGISVAPDGKVWAVGTGGTSNRFAVARLTSDGLLDTTFSSDGKLIIGGSAGAAGVQALPGGKVLLGVPRLTPEPRGYQAIRLNDNGTYDSTFGVGGVGFIQTSSQVYINSLKVQPDNKILIGGYDVFSGDWNFVITRFNSDGSPDNSFGTGGRIVTNFNRTGFSTPQDNLEALSVLSDGRIIAGGHSEYDFALACYLSDGTPDPSFGENGKRVFSIGAGSLLDSVTDIYPLPDGKFLGTMGLSNETSLARFSADGSLDPSFGNGGRIIAPSNAPWRDPNAVLVDPQGRILLGNYGSFSVTRLLPDGSVDSSFGANGTFDINLGTVFREEVTSLDWAPDGDLIIGGYTTVTANVDSNWHVARLDIGPPSPTQTISLAPTFDVKANPGMVRSITEGETGLFVGLGFDAQNPEERPIFEFPLASIPDGAMITAATLKLDPYASSGSPRIELQSFAGDGLASIADITSPGTVVATSGPVDAGMASIDIDLNPDSLQALLETATYLGLRLRSLDLPLYVGFSSSEATFGTPPRLSVTYTLPTVPGDFNKDGVIDGNDLIIWRAAYGIDNKGDADEDGDTDGRDYLIWQRNISPAVPISESLRAVPEPQSQLLLLCALTMWTNMRKGVVHTP